MIKCSGENSQVENQNTQWKLCQQDESIQHLFTSLNDCRTQIDQLKLAMCTKVQKADLDSLLHFKANKQTVANALSKKAYKATVEEIAKEVTQVVVNLDAGLKNITDTVNTKVSDINLKVKEET